MVQWFNGFVQVLYVFSQFQLRKLGNHITMASKLPPVHPYSIMLYEISKYLSGKKDKIIDLARIMGLRKFGTIDNVADLFDKLEDEGCLSEFKVTDLGKALDIIDLPEAARKVKEYEEQGELNLH